MTEFFNFRDEVCYKYDINVYEAYMETFDALPLSAVARGEYSAERSELSIN